MIRLNIHEAKTHLSKYLERLAGGETILLCKHNVHSGDPSAPPGETIPTAHRACRGSIQAAALLFRAVAR